MAGGFATTGRRRPERDDPSAGALRDLRAELAALRRDVAVRPRVISGPGKLYLASPLTVAASAVEGRIVEYQDGMFRPR